MSDLIAPFWAYREPPNGLTAEWQRIYRALVDPATVLATFKAQADFARRGTRELLEAWLDKLRSSEGTMNIVLSQLHGRAPSTWRAGHAIRNVVGPIIAIMASTTRFMAQSEPTQTGVDATVNGLRAEIVKQLEAFDPLRLLDELAAAVVNDCARQQSPAAVTPEVPPIDFLNDTQQYVTLDQMGAVVKRSKRTMEKLKTRKTNPLPPPDVEGGGGKPAEWLWTTVRQWLEAEFERPLPEHFPRLRQS